MHYSQPLLDRAPWLLQTIWYCYVKNRRPAVVSRWRNSCAPAPGVSTMYINILETNIAVIPKRQFKLYFQTLTQLYLMGKGNYTTKYYIQNSAVLYVLESRPQHMRHSAFAPEESQIILVACAKVVNNIYFLIFCFKQQKIQRKRSLQMHAARKNKFSDIPVFYSCERNSNSYQYILFGRYINVGCLCAYAARLDFQTRTMWLLP
ncbi:Hypothetical_protein [Hexamita inflata]|uniref:Hypothetical_protein n=1 Tax=Hexamita inflata TaxID=28002 RepID=A0AA86UEV9_9EUKA|nr:Hypothetical protein HINF_LOCUS25938 [Hexamita inflata]